MINSLTIEHTDLNFATLQQELNNNDYDELVLSEVNFKNKEDSDMFFNFLITQNKIRSLTLLGRKRRFDRLTKYRRWWRVMPYIIRCNRTVIYPFIDNGYGLFNSRKSSLLERNFATLSWPTLSRYL